MKNILARGGIEFLAVMLGLSGSLWVDNTVKENDHKTQNNKILKRLYNNLEADSIDAVWNYKAHSIGLKGSENILKWCDSNPTFLSVNDSVEKDISSMIIGTLFVNNDEEYNALKNSGRMDLINNEKIIIKLHKYYTTLGFIKDIDNQFNNYTENQIKPFLSLYSNEYLFDENVKKNIIYKTYQKINIIKMPDINRLRFFTTDALSFQKYLKNLYKNEINRVTELRKLLRKELKI